MTDLQTQAFRPGVYRHYKGNEYVASDIALHSETQEPMVIYRCLYGERGLWVRPLSMFLEYVEIDSVEVARFAWLRPAPSPSDSD